MARSDSASHTHPTDRIVGHAPSMQALRTQICHLVAFDTVGSAFVPTLLLQGETGTGKGLVARVIHDSGPRAQGPFVDINCAAIPETLLEAELFGFEAGTFTDARRSKPGLMESAAQGTLFLDEIEALPALLQSKLLSVLDDKRVRRLGAVTQRQIDVKLIAASPTDLSQCVAQGRFRPDLYHRLAVLLLEIPPLRQRGTDIVLLAQHFVQQYAAAHGLPAKQFSRDAESWLCHYGWPGNVRELRHLMERLTLLRSETVISADTLEHLCLARPTGAVDSAVTPVGSVETPLDEPARIRQALAQAGGNVLQTARLLGLPRGAVRYRMRQYGIRRPTLSAVFPRQGHRGQAASRPSEVHQGPASSAELLVSDWAWEQKTVVVLALDVTWLEGMGQSASPALDPWTRALRWRQTVVEQLQGFGGHLVQASPSLLIAVFGLLQTLEQMPQRAVHAALAMRRQLAEGRETQAGQAAPVVRLAVHLGQVLVDVQARDPTARFLPLGETLSLPVRLLGHAAPGDILLSSEVGRLLDGWFKLQAQAGPGTALLGGSGAYAVVGLRKERSPLEAYGKRPLSHFVDRERELADLGNLLSRVAQGSGQIVAIVGEPGVGKSRLCYELTRIQRSQGWHILASSPTAYGQNTPYLPVIEWLMTYFQIGSGDTPPTVHHKVVGTLRALDEGLLSLLPPMLALLDLAVDEPHWQTLEPPQRRQRTLEACARLLLRMSQAQPLLLVLENLHWIDTETQAVLDRLVDSLRAARILLLVNYRPEYQHAWSGKTYYTQLRLDPLAPVPATALLHDLLGTRETLEPLIQCLIARTEGNPFFLEESVRTLEESGALVGTRGAYHLARDLLSLPVPDAVQVVLAARIDRLPPAAKQLLQTAAVIGVQVSVPLLKAMDEMPETTLHSCLVHLQRAEFIYEVQPFPEHIYTFKHALTHEVAYGSLLQERRRMLHARLVEALEALAPERLAEQTERLAQHALRGEVWDKAVAYCQQAGSRAFDRAAFGAAATAFAQALQAVAHLPEADETRALAIDLRLALVRTLNSLGEHERRLALLGEAETLARELDDRARLGLVLASMAHVLRRMGDLAGAMAAGQQALVLASALDDHALQGEASLRLGQVYQGSGDFGRAVEILRQLVETAAGESGRLSRDLRIDAQTGLALALGTLGAFAEGRHHGEEALRLATLYGRGNPLIISHVRLGILYLAQGDLEHAIPVLDQSLALCRAADHRELWRSAAAGLGSAYALQGRLPEGCALLEEAISESLRMGGLQGQAERLAQLSEVYRLAGRSTEAEQQARQALHLARQHQECGDEALALHQLGTVLAHVDPPETEQAKTYYQQGLALAENLGMRPLAAHCFRGLGLLYAQAGQAEQARVALATAIDLYRSMQMTFWLPQTETALAHVEAL